MKKRILAMLLAVCMVLLSVPMFVLPATAALPTRNYKTSFNSTTNLPTISGGVVTTYGNWQPMAYVKGLNNQAFPLTQAQHPSFASTQTIGFTDWPNATYIPGWAAKAGMMIANPNNAQPGYFNTPGQVNVTDKCSAGVRYTAEKSGTINITFDKLGNYNAGGDPNGPPLGLENFRYGIFLNGVMVWPVAGGTLSETPALDSNKTDLLAVTDLSVKAGDAIDFICEAEKPCNQWPGAANVMFPTIEYTFEANTKVTSFNSTTNLPTISGSTIATSGGWTPMGYLRSNGYSDPSQAYLLDQSDYNATVGYHKFAAPSHWPGGAITGWAVKPFMLLKMDAGRAPNAYFSTPGALSVAQPFSGGVRYTAEETGIIDITFDQLGNISTAADNIGLANYRYGIFHNGTMVWPVAGGTLSETPALDSNKTDLLAVTDLKVKEGDVIDFICEAEKPTNNWTGAGNIMFPTIEYTTIIEIAHSSRFNGIAGMPTVDGGKVTGSNGWMPMAYTKAHGYNDISKANPMNVSNNLIINTGTFAIADYWPGGDIAGWRNKSSMTVKATHSEGTDNAKCFHTPGTFNVTSEQSGGLRYTAEKTGYIEFILDKIGNIVDDETVIGQGANQSKPCSNDKFRYGVFLNGEMIWPVAGGTLSKTAPLSAETLSEIVVAENLKVFVGDVIDIICEVEGAKETVNQWQGAGNVMFATVNYTQVNEYSFAFNGETNLPTIVEDAEGNRTVSYYGSFYPIAYDKTEEGFTYSDPTSALLMDAASPANPNSNPLAAIAPKTSSGGGMTRSLMVLESCNVNYWRELGQINVTGQMSGGIRYVADETGTIDIDLSRLGNNVPDSALADAALGVSKMTFYVYVNGEEVWSLKGSVLAEEFAKKAYGDKYQPGQMKAAGLKLNVPVATGIDVVLGDTIDFIVEGTGIPEASPHAGAGNIMFPIITYTTVIPKATTSANVSMSSNFAVNVKMTLPEEALYSMTGFGLLVDGEEFPLVQESDTVYSAHNVLKAYVQDLKSDYVTFQPYYTYLDDEAGEVTIWGNEQTVNIYELLEAYRDGEDAAAAALAEVIIGKRGYVEAATAYFDALLSEDGLGNAVVPEEEEDLSDILVPNPSEPIVMENPDATVDFTGVSLILNNALALKLHLALPEDADVTNYALIAIDPITMSEGLGFDDAGVPAGAQMNPLKEYNAVGDGNAVAYFGTTFENMDRMYVFYVMDLENGEIVSDAVFYNPLTYATTMARDAEVGTVCRALLELNKAIDIYTGAIANR